MKRRNRFVVLISADAEWRVVRKYFLTEKISKSPYGEWFSNTYSDFPIIEESVIFIHGGWGKVASAASTQYLINKWHPQLIINLGTCGGFEGEINKGEVILVNKTVIYDIYEQMGDPDEHILYYCTEIDTSWIDQHLPLPVRGLLLVSGDRDIFKNDIPLLRAKYNAIAGDWESGAIAWVANKNHTQCLILRGVTDLVGESGGEAYDGNVNIFYENTQQIMNTLLDSLPHWLIKYIQRNQR
jgi:adenosylhomocysteine nucleosidase